MEEVINEVVVTSIETEQAFAMVTKFLQQAITDVYSLLHKLKAVDVWIMVEKVSKRTQSTLHCYFDLNPQFENVANKASMVVVGMVCDAI